MSYFNTVHSVTRRIYTTTLLFILQPINICITYNHLTCILRDTWSRSGCRSGFRSDFPRGGSTLTDTYTHAHDQSPHTHICVANLVCGACRSSPRASKGYWLCDINFVFGACRVPHKRLASSWRGVGTNSYDIILSIYGYHNYWANSLLSKTTNRSKTWCSRIVKLCFGFMYYVFIICIKCSTSSVFSNQQFNGFIHVIVLI